MNRASGAVHRKHYRCVIPQDAAPHYGEMTIETDACNEADMRHMLLCMLGKRAAADAVITEATEPPAA